MYNNRKYIIEKLRQLLVNNVILYYLVFEY